MSMLNDILDEDNRIFQQENYKLNPPEKTIADHKKGPWPDPSGKGMGSMENIYGRREPSYNKENNFGQFPGGQYDDDVAWDLTENYSQGQGKRCPYGQQHPNKSPYQNKKKEMTYYPHPDFHFCEKKNKEYIPKEAKLRKDTIHVFGVDFFSEEDLKEFFKGFCPQRFEWINDSSVNVIFADMESASNALFSKTTQVEDQVHELDWRRGLDIEKDGKSFNFQIRYATDQDAKDPLTKGVFSKYYKFVKQQTFNKKKGANKKVQKGKAQKQELPPKKGNTMTLMDRKKPFGKKIVKKYYEYMPKLDFGGEYENNTEDYPPSFNDLNPYNQGPPHHSSRLGGYQ